MSRVKNTYWLLCIALTVVVTGCLRSAGDSGLSNIESLDLPTPTPIPTAIPTLTPETIVITATSEPTDEADVVQPATLVAQGAEATTQGILPTQDTGFQAQEVTDPNFLTATGIVEHATQTSVAATATALGPQVQLPTFTPTFDPNLFPATPTPTQPFATGANCIHEVVAGENLYRLSIRYGVSVADLATASGISNFNLVYPGQKITVPGCGTTGAVPPPTSVPTSVPQSTAFDTSSASGTAVSSTPFASAGGVQHTVQQYETLFEISLMYGVPVDAIAQANGITNPNLIYMTQVLTIP